MSKKRMNFIAMVCSWTAGAAVAGVGLSVGKVVAMAAAVAFGGLPILPRMMGASSSSLSESILLELAEVLENGDGTLSRNSPGCLSECPRIKDDALTKLVGGSGLGIGQDMIGAWGTAANPKLTLG